jgi:hypothetical protein
MAHGAQECGQQNDRALRPARRGDAQPPDLVQRKHYAETASAFMMSRPAPDTEGLRFEVAHGGTADVDEVMIAGAMAHQLREKARDVVSGEKR